jgi:hypothetical protein
MPHSDDPLRDYFDQLDAAFDSLETAPAADPQLKPPFDLDDETAQLEVPTLRSVLRSPRPSIGTDPFEVLVAADKESPLTTPAVPAVAPQPIVTEELVEAVAARVIERLAPRGTTELVTRIVAEIAERLVREEIDRIRGRK